METKYSNPRLEAEIDNWPTGSYRTKAIFKIEQTARGERGTRVTFHPITGKPAAPKKLTYARKARIVDGDDGRTYIIELTSFGFISVRKGDMKFEHESIFEENPKYAEVRKLFD